MIRGLALAVVALVACGNGAGGGQPPLPSSTAASLCASAPPEAYGVMPFGNQTKTPLALAGGNDLLSDSMQRTGCFQLLEHERRDVLISEMKLCSDANPDKEYLNCHSFAQKGQLLGLQRMVLADVVSFEPDVKGGELALKIPGLPMAGIDLGRSYAALSLSVKVVDVATSTVKASAVVHALLPSDKANVGVASGGFDLHASIKNKSPFGEELQGMLQRATLDLAKQLGPAAP